MNRGRSSDSLDNGDVDIICSSSGSSSSTDFTSDDETGGNISNLYLISGQPSNKTRARNLATHGQSNNIAKYTHSLDYQSDYTPRYMCQPNNPMVGSNDHLLLNSIDSRPMDHSLGASTSYHNDSGLSSGHHINSLSSRILESLPNSSMAPLTDQSLVPRHSNQIKDAREAFYDMIRNGQDPTGHSSNALSNENCENVDLILSVESDESELYGRVNSPIETSLPTLLGTGPSRGMNTIAARMCSKLLECRNLIEAIEFIEQNRDIIDSRTSIITREAPAFRNYEIGNYQIDYSIKESFNPNFWHDREPVVTTADGNCQYHAVSLSLTGSEAYTPEVRLATAVAVIDNREYFDSMLRLIDRGTILDLVHTTARNHSWGDETTLKAIAVAINRRIFLYTCNLGKKDYEMVKSLSKEELLDAFKEKKYRGGTGIHTYADPLIHVPANNYIMLFHKSEHFIAVLPTGQQLTMFEPYNPIVPVFT